MTISEIIKRLEAGETGREINRAIADFVDPNIERFGMKLPTYDWRKIAAGAEMVDEGPRRDLCPSFTTSLDAALTLVPEGYHWSVYDTDGLDSANAQVEPPDYSTAPWNGTAKTPAAALTLAALKAREAQS